MGNITDLGDVGPYMDNPAINRWLFTTMRTRNHAPCEGQRLIKPRWLGEWLYASAQRVAQCHENLIKRTHTDRQREGERHARWLSVPQRSSACHRELGTRLILRRASRADRHGSVATLTTTIYCRQAGKLGSVICLSLIHI